MKRSAVFVLMITLMFSLSVQRAAAQEGRHLDLRSIVEVEREVINDLGEKEIRVESAERILPGEIIVFGTIFTNVGEETADNIILTNPVPENTAYIGGSAGGEGAVITFSVDGGQTYDVPGNLKITGEDGKQRPALPEEYTHIRWTLNKPLNPGEKGKVSFKSVLQ